MESKQVQKSLQVLLWLWFGLMTSFVAVGVVNIAKLETESRAMHKQIDNLSTRILHYQKLLSK